MFNIFQHPWGLLTAAIIVLLVLLMFRRISPEKQKWHHWLLPLLLAVVAFAADSLVQTDIEKIKTVIDIGVKAVQQENPGAIDAIISDNYRDSYHNTKRKLMDRCRIWLSEPLVEKNIKRILDLQIAPPTATVTFTVRTLFDERSAVYQGFKREMFTKLKVDLQKQPDKSWLISRAEILEIDRIPANWQNIGQVSW